MKKKNISKKSISKATIFIKLMSFNLLLVIVPVSILGFIGVINFTNATEKQTIAQMQASSANKLDLLQQIIDGVKREAYASAYDANAINILTDISNGETALKAGEIDTKRKLVGTHLKDLFARNTGMFENFFYTDNKGKIIVDALDGKTVGIDVSARDYYTSPSKNGNVAVSDVVISQSTGEPVLVISVPLYDNNKKFIGIFSMSIHFNKLTELIIKRTNGLNYNFAIFNSQGMIIAHENKGMIFKSSLNENQTQTILFEQMKQGKAGYGFYTKSGVNKLMTYEPYKEKNWYVCTAETVNDYLSPINNFKVITLLIGIICVVISAFITFFFSRYIANPLKKLSIITSAVSSGNLTQKMEVSKSKDEMGQLSSNFANMVNNLRSLISQVNAMSENVTASSQEMMESSEEVSKVSDQIAVAITEQAKGATEQAVSSEKGNAKIIEVVKGLNNIVAEMSKSEKLVEEAKNTVKIGQKSVEYQEVKMNENLQVSYNASNAVSSLSEKSKEIGNVLSVIQSISDQTNLLALNAAIEAARAGEQGRGFAVVADEIRKLAEQSSMSIKKIETIIKEVQSGVELAVTEMGKAKNAVDDQEKALLDTVKSFDNIYKVVADINDNIKSVAEVSNSLSLNAKAAGDVIHDIASISQETASGTEEISASIEEQSAAIHEITKSSENLSNLSKELQKSISKFTI